MTKTVPSLVIHLHLYQPPREDPWWGVVPEEPNAAPDHDWNRRIDRECYAPLTAARVTDRAGRILEVVNLLEWTSFDVGPTLMRWLEAESPETYRAILLAEARSRARQGVGNAVAAPYHHVILPLASQADKRTEVRWGIRDFECRFGGRPTGMWIPETAVDIATLEVLAEQGIRFTILAPHQVDPLPEGGAPGRIRLSGGREIVVFPYDGGLAHDVAFGALIRDADAWIRRIEEAADREGTALISMATDAETFGHHHALGEVALSAVIRHFRDGPTLRVESYAARLSRGGPLEDVSLVEETSWSCAHGVERWRSDCGCGPTPEDHTQQAWRAPVREAVRLVQTMAHEAYLDEAGAVFQDPLGVRDEFGEVLDASLEERRAFVARNARLDVPPGAEARALQLLEMERNALAAATSCAWFFEDFAGLEGTQVLGYLVRTLELLQGSWPPSVAPGLTGLEAAESNDPEVGNALELIERRFLSRTSAAVAVAAGARLSLKLSDGSAGESEGPPHLGPWRIKNAQGSMLTVVDERTGQSWTLGPREELEP